MKFIRRFTQGGKNRGTIETFTQGCCFWFAFVLRERFYDPNDRNQNVDIMYDQIANHFGCRIDGAVYDITGDVTEKYNWQTWVSLMNEDELLAEHIIRDCIDFQLSGGDSYGIR